MPETPNLDVGHFLEVRVHLKISAYRERLQLLYGLPRSKEA